jgi:hypothetical protein
MPLYGSVMRVRKGLFEVVIKFVASKRVLHVERIGAPNVTAVKLFFRREYPTLTWGKPKYPKPPKIAKERVHVIKPRAKKVLRPRKKPVRDEVSNPLPTTRRRNPTARPEL